MRSERPRGAEVRWFEDAQEGDEIGPRVKGPLTVTDIISWHVFVGMGLYGVAALRLGFQSRHRIPRFYLYHRDELGIPDAMQRCHWDPEYARKAGNPTTYDYGRMPDAWLAHLCTDWMGDVAWLWKRHAQPRVHGALTPAEAFTFTNAARRARRGCVRARLRPFGGVRAGRSRRAAPPTGFPRRARSSP